VVLERIVCGVSCVNSLSMFWTMFGYFTVANNYTWGMQNK
jgi:hypothetical protein